MRPILGRPMIARQWDRLKRATRIDRLVVATSIDPTDDVLAAFCAENAMPVFRGSLTDVLDRFVGAAKAFGPAGHIVRLTADCPLADPVIIDATIDLHLRTGADYTSNAVTRTFPDGLDVEIMRIEALERAAREAPPGPAREHVTMHIYRHPETFLLAAFTQACDQSHWRWTVDTPADFDMVSRVYAALMLENPAFTSAEIAEYLARHPEIVTINNALGT